MNTSRIAFVMTALFILITIFSVTTTLESMQVNDNNTEITNQRTDYLVDFEGDGETKASYASGDVNLSGKDWNLDNVLIGTTDSDRKFGERSARFRHQSALAGTMTMLEDKDSGLGTLSFYYARSGFSNDNQPTAPIIVAEYSTDQGNEWIQIGNDISLDGVDELTLFSYTVNLEGNIRVRIRSIAGSDGRRFNIDDILLTDYGDPVAVAPPTFSPSGGTYYNPVFVTISTATPDATIHYTTDGTDPTQSSPVFTDPIEITETTTLKARGYADDLEPSIISTAVYTINVPVEVLDIAALKAAPQDGTVYTLANEVILTFQQSFRNQKYIQDDTAGILIDDDAGLITTEYVVGDGILNLLGTTNTYGQMIQFTPIQDPGPANSSNNQIVALTITMDDYLYDFMEYQSRVVKIEDVHFTTADGTLEFTNGTVYPLSDGTEIIDFRTTFYDVDYIGEVIPQEVISLRGIPNSRTEGHFFTARNLADFLPPSGAIDVEIFPPSADFGDVIVDEVSDPVSFILTNNGSITVSVIDLYIDGDDDTEFILDDTNVYPVELEPEEELEFTVSFAPTSTGSKSAYVEIEVADDFSSVLYEVGLSGNGIILSPPDNLEANIINWHDVELTWDIPETRVGNRNRNLVGFDVYRNGILISPDTPLSPDTDFFIDEAVPSGYYEYNVEAIYSAGSISSETVTIDIGQVTDVIMSPEPGEYVDQVEVSLAVDSRHREEVIYYTLDGTEPSDGSTLYEEPFILIETTTVKAIAYKVGSETSGVTTGEYEIVVSAEDETVEPLTTSLKQNVPNPFNPDTVINFTLKTRDRVLIEIYNVKGKRIDTLIDDELPAGIHNVVWEGTDARGSSMPSGVYFYRMKTTDHLEIRKMIMIK
jgi:hypothetical protein